MSVESDPSPTVLFLCVHNAGRSQMALGWFTHLAGDRAVAWSGGSEPGSEVNPSAIAVMAEVGIDITAEYPKRWTDEIVRAADVVITMGCGDACPYFPGKRYEDWALDDPAGQGVEAVRPIRDEIERRVRELLEDLGVATSSALPPVPSRSGVGSLRPVSDSVPDLEGAPVPASILVICAHPDDVDFGAAGSVATWTAAGAVVTYCIVTSGQAGSDDRTRTPDDIAAERIREQTAAAAVVGVTDLIWLGHPDGALVATLDLRRDLTRAIRTVRPDRVVTQSPILNLDRIYASHPDHLAAGAAALAAVYPDSRNPHAFPELLDEGHEPWTVPEVWLMAGPTTPEASRVHVDITDTIDAKIAALRCHRSQNAAWAELDEMIRAWGVAVGVEVGLTDGGCAEAFRRVDTR